MNKILRRFAWMFFSWGLAACVPFDFESLGLNKLEPSIPLFILAGQSNMQGQTGDAAAYPADPQNLDPGIPFYWAIPRVNQRSEVWTHLGPQPGFYRAGHFGPEVSFARQQPQPAAFFKFSLGGTGLAKDWKGPGEGGLYDQLCREYKRALELLAEQGQVPDPQVLIWIQGESDVETPELAEQYRERLQRLIDDFRQNQVGDAELPVMLGLDEQHPWVVNNPQVITAQEAIAAADPNIIRTSMVGLEKADATHLTPAGLVEHGDRLNAAYLKLISQKPPRS